MISPLVPIPLSNGEVAFESQLVPSFTAIPDGCIQWTDGACSICDVIEGRPANCRKANERCQFTKCMPFCAKFEDVYQSPQHCKNWFDGCNRCMMQEHRELFVSEVNGQRFERVTYGPMGGCTRMFCQQKDRPKCTNF